MAVTVRTDEALEQALTSLATSEQASRQEIVRRAVLERYERTTHGARVAASANRVADQWADVLERLRST